MLDDANNIENSENRTTDCCCETRPAPDVSINCYKFTDNKATEDISCEDKKKTRKEMINKIRSLSFAIVELAEYLDTHPDDKKALALHREYANALHELKEEYQKIYGPLTFDFPCNKWRWIEEPWPWERGNF